MNTATVTRSRRWIWFWVLLVLFALVAIIVPIVYNLNQQLKPEQIAAARAKWQASGIQDYDMVYQERLNNETEATGFKVEVRAGKVVAAYCDDELLPPGEWEQHTVEALFAKMEKDVNDNITSGNKRNYVSAHFDKKNGFPIRYVFRIRGTKERQEWNIRLTPQ